jgi:predicted MFS family arabinose efflux permease
VALAELPSIGVMMARRTDSNSPFRLIATLCTAQVLVQIGAFFWPALLPEMIGRWSLTNSEAGWITAAFYGAYMLAVPILVTLTDRIDAKRVYLGGVAAMVLGHATLAMLADGFWSAVVARSLTGIGWAGTYMTGLKLLADKVDAKTLSRAAAWHAASIGISGALSYVCADLLANTGGWRVAFAAASVSAMTAWLIVILAVPRRGQETKAATTGTGLFDFRPVLRNRSAMAYAVAYGLHTLEMAALRGWGVAFLAYVAVSTGASHSLMSPTLTLTVLALLGTLASLVGNEAAIRFGRRALISAAIGGSVVLAVLLALFGLRSYPLAVALMLAYGAVIWLDSASLTAGRAGTA